MGGAGRGAAPLEGQRSSIAVLLELDYRQPVLLCRSVSLTITGGGRLHGLY